MWVAYSENWCYNHQASFLGSAQQNISLFSLFLILAVKKKIVWLKWLGKAVHTIFAVIFASIFITFVGGKSEIDMSESVLYSFVTHLLTFFPRLGLGVPPGLILAARSRVRFFAGVKGHNSLFSLQPSSTSAYAGCSRWIWTKTFWSHLLLQRAAYLCHWWWCLFYRASYENRGFIIPTTANRRGFKIFITKSIWKRPKARIFKASQNILHDKWNWMCRGHHPVILCNSVFCRKRSHDSNIKRL